MAAAMTDETSFFELTEQYPDEESAIEYFTDHRWPEGPHCPKCGSFSAYDANAKRRLPLWKCGDCDHQFTVTSGTVTEGTKLPLRQWLFAFHILGASKKGISSRQLARMMGVTLKTAWHLSHRIRATMRQDGQFFSHGKYNSREQSDTARTEAAIQNMEGKRVTLFKSTSGKGESLFDRRAKEKTKHGTMRGQHMKRKARAKADAAKAPKADEPDGGE